MDVHDVAVKPHRVRPLDGLFFGSDMNFLDENEPLSDNDFFSYDRDYGNTVLGTRLRHGFDDLVLRNPSLLVGELPFLQIETYVLIIDPFFDDDSAPLNGFPIYPKLLFNDLNGALVLQNWSGLFLGGGGCIALLGHQL